MTASGHKTLIPHYLLTGLLLGTLVFYSFKLYTYSKYSRQLVATIQSLQTTGGSPPAYDSNFKANIEKQLALAASENAGWALALKKDSAAYPRNIAVHAFRNMKKFDEVLADMSLNNDTVLCRLLVRDKKPFYVTVKFIRKGNIFLLDDLDNICALYNRLNCHEQYLSEGEKMQNLK